MKYCAKLLCVSALLLLPVNFSHAQAKQTNIGSGCWYKAVAKGSKKYKIFGKTKRQCETRVKARFPKSAGRCSKTRQCAGAVKRKEPIIKY